MKTKLKINFLLTLLTLILICCNSRIEKQEVIKNVEKPLTERVFFKYDEINYFSNILDNETPTLFQNQLKSAEDSLKFGVIIGKIPKRYIGFKFH